MSAACTTSPAFAEGLAEHHSHEWDRDDEADDTIEMRRDAGRTLEWRSPVNSFMAAGEDNFTVLPQGRNQVGGPLDLDALIAYIQSLPQPFSAAVEERIVRLN